MVAVRALTPLEDREGFIPSHVTACLTIDLKAIRENYRSLQRNVGQGVQVAGVVKANAYGLGMEEVATALYQEGCRTFFVADPGEGLALRRLLKDVRIFVFHGVLAGAEPLFEEANLIPVLNDLDQVKRWSLWGQARGGKRPAVLHFDTGMTRNGLGKEETIELLRHPDRLKGIDLSMILSHLASSDDSCSPQNEKQMRAFKSILQAFPDIPCSFSNSCGLALGESYYFNWVRPGIALYGYPLSPLSFSLRSALSLQARIIQIHEVKSGQSVGYNGTYRAPKKGRLATLGIGYADGLFRSLSNKGVLRAGKSPLSIVGRISMDYTVVDVSSLPESLCRIGDWVTVFEDSEDLLRLAQEAGTIPYEVLTRLGERCYRRYER